MKTKLDYTKSYKKKIVQKIIFEDVQKQGITKLVGLAGPNITNYLSFVKSMGIKTVEIYENNSNSLLQQLTTFKPIIQTTVKYQDILAADLNSDVVYDLDFCCSIKKASDHIQKFKTNSIITVSVRPIGILESLKTFCTLVSNLKFSISINFEKNKNYSLHKIHFSNGVIYDCYQYKDTVPMLTFKPNFIK